MKKILFFINTLNGGGAERVLIDLLEALPKDEFDITLYSVNGGVYENRIPAHINNKKIVPFKNRFLRNLFSRIVFHLSPKTVARLLIKGEYDVEIAYLEGFSTKTIASRKTHAARAAFIHCNIETHNFIKAYYPSIDACKKEYNLFDKTCFVSKQALCGFEHTVGRLQNSCVLENVINIAKIKERAKQKSNFSFSTNGLKIITVGRLVPVKRFDRLINAAAKLEKHFDFEIHIMGEGSERSALEDLTKKQNVSSVKFLGFDANPLPHISSADLFVCSSQSEGYSTATLEALALGLPILSTDCGGPSEILQDGKAGFLVENSSKGIFNGLFEVLNSPELLNELKTKAEQSNISLLYEQNLEKYVNFLNDF